VSAARDPLLHADDELLQELLDGRLEADEAQALRARIEREPALAEAWRDLRALQGWVREYMADAEPPADLAAAVRARAESSAEAPPAWPPPRGRLRRAITVAYALAALVVAGLTVHAVLDSGGEAGRKPTDVARNDAPRASAPAESPPEDAEALDRLREKAPVTRRAAPRAESADAAKPPATRALRKDGPPAPGTFGAPGGGVPPGLRTPGSPTPPPSEDAAPARPRARDPAPGAGRGVWGRMQRDLDAGAVVYVVETSDPLKARGELAALLDRLGGATDKTVRAEGAAPKADAGSEEPKAAPMETKARPAPDVRGAASKAKERGRGSGGGGTSALARFYRVRSPAGPGLAAGPTAGGRDAYSGWSLTRVLPAGALARLEALAAPAPAPRKAQPAGAPATKPPPGAAPTTPAAPAAPKAKATGPTAPPLPTRPAPVRVRIYILQRGR
jgi:hypothetical protein